MRRGSSDADHLELGEAGHKFAQRGVGPLKVYLVHLASMEEQVVERAGRAAVKLLPERTGRCIQAVVDERVEVEQHACAVGQRREDGLCSFLYTHSRKNISLNRLFAQARRGTFE